MKALGGTDRYAPGHAGRLHRATSRSRPRRRRALVEDLTLSSRAGRRRGVLAIVLFYGWRRSVPALFLPLAVATVYAFALASLPPFGITELNSNTAFLGSIIVGNGINFGIIQLARYVEARRHGRDGRGRAGAGAVGDAQGDALGGAGGGRRLRVAGRDAVPRLPAVRRDRRPRHAARVGGDLSS